jgi:phosphoglycolate phosphatase
LRVPAFFCNPWELAVPYPTSDALVILDADGTLIDAFGAIAMAFAEHGMDIGDLDRFQKRHNLFKYFGGAKEFPRNLTRQLSTRSRKELLATLTEVYRQRAALYPGTADWLAQLLAAPGVRVALVTRNVCNEPELTLQRLFARHEIDIRSFDMLHHLPLRGDKSEFFRLTREHLGINPARTLVCGDEHRDYEAALRAAARPWIACYGFEDFDRLSRKFGIPEPVLCRDPFILGDRVRHSLGL